MEQEKILSTLSEKLGETSFSPQTLQTYVELNPIAEGSEPDEAYWNKAVNFLKGMQGQYNHDVATRVEDFKKNYKPQPTPPTPPTPPVPPKNDDELEKKLKTYCAKVGIVEGMFNYVFNSDSTFTNALKKKTLKGTFSVNPDEKTVELKYALGGKLKVTTLTAHVVISGDELSLLFNADKLLDFLSKISSISDNSTLKLVNKLASEYEGMMLGFELKK